MKGIGDFMRILQINAVFDISSTGKIAYRLQEFINENYGGSYIKLAREINKWHCSEVFKTYGGGHNCAIKIWAEGNSKPVKMRWAWLLLKKYIRVKFGIRVYDYWLTPRDVEEPEPVNNAPELFSEDDQEKIQESAEEDTKQTVWSYSDALNMIIEGLSILKSLLER